MTPLSVTSEPPFAFLTRLEEVRQVWNVAREDGIELDIVFWRALLQGEGSQLSHWRRTVRSIGWLK